MLFKFGRDRLDGEPAGLTFRRAATAEDAYQTGADGTLLLDKLIAVLEGRGVALHDATPAASESFNVLAGTSYFAFSDHLSVLLKEITSIGGWANDALTGRRSFGLEDCRKQERRFLQLQSDCRAAQSRFGEFEQEAARVLPHLWNVLAVARSVGIADPDPPGPVHAEMPLDFSEDAINSLLARHSLDVPVERERPFTLDAISHLLARAAANAGRVVHRPAALDDRTAQIVADYLWCSFETEQRDAFMRGDPVSITLADGFRQTQVHLDAALQEVPQKLRLLRRHLKGSR